LRPQRRRYEGGEEHLAIVVAAIVEAALPSRSPSTLRVAARRGAITRKAWAPEQDARVIAILGSLAVA
jgi:hypothetical protein